MRMIPLGQVRIDEYRKTCVNRTTMAYHADPFILASDATQIFFMEDPLHKNGHLAIHRKRRVLGVNDVADEDEYDEFDELPAKGSRTRVTEQRKIIKNPKFIWGQLSDPIPPCTWELSRKTSLYAYRAT